MKFILILTMIMAVLVTGCENNTQDSSQGEQMSESANDEVSVLRTKGIELLSKIDMASEEENYVKLFSYSEEINDIISNIGAQEYSQPTQIYSVSGINELMTKWSTSQIDGELSPELEKIVSSKLSPSISNVLNGAMGAEMIAATSIINMTDNFIYEGLDSDLLYLYMYNGEYCGLVSFFPYEDNIVNAYASIVSSSSFENINGVEDIELFFSEIATLLGYENEDAIDTENILKVEEIELD